MVDYLDTRRRFLQGAGASGTALLAGCVEQLGFGGDAEGDARRIAIVVDVPQEEFQQIQLDVQAELEAGDLEQDEAQRELQERQLELLDDALTSMAETLESEFAVTVDEQHTELGAVLASGAADDLLDALDADQIAAFLPSTDLEVAAEGP